MLMNIYHAIKDLKTDIIGQTLKHTQHELIRSIQGLKCLKLLQTVLTKFFLKQITYFLCLLKTTEYNLAFHGDFESMYELHCT